MAKKPATMKHKPRMRAKRICRSPRSLTATCPLQVPRRRPIVYPPRFASIPTGKPPPRLIAVRGARIVPLVLSVLIPVAQAGAIGLAGPAGAAGRHAYVIRDRMAGRDRMKPNLHQGEQGDTTVEPSIAVNPEDPNNAVAVYQEGRVDWGGGKCKGCATTCDGG